MRYKRHGDKCAPLTDFSYEGKGGGDCTKQGYSAVELEVMLCNAIGFTFVNMSARNECGGAIKGDCYATGRSMKKISAIPPGVYITETRERDFRP